MKFRSNQNLLLSVYCSSQAFAWVLFEGSFSPVDWGIGETKGTAKNRRATEIFVDVVDRYKPDLVAIERRLGTERQRTTRIRILNIAFRAYCKGRNVPAACISLTQVKSFFDAFGYETKLNRAEAISNLIPYFGQYLPPKRNIWGSEDARMCLFDACALALIAHNDGMTQQTDQ